MVQATFTISGEEFTEEVFKKIKNYLRGQSASVTIRIETIPGEAMLTESGSNYFLQLDQSLAELDRGEGLPFSKEEFEALAKK